MIEDPVGNIEELEETQKNQYVKRGLMLLAFFLLVFLLIGSYIIYLNQPLDFDGNVTFVVKEGDSVPEITKQLETAGVIKSDQLLYLILVTFFDPTQIKASNYDIDTPMTTYEVAERLISGDFDTDLIPLIVFEGESRKKIAERLSQEFDWFDEERFMNSTSELEGRLFPETYFIPSDYSTDELILLLNNSYLEVISDYSSEISDASFTESEIVTLASIVEREANDETSMKLVAGIFLNRLALGMALQADASIEYVIDEELNDLPPGVLAESLREVDSPYNTYLYPGLPPTPIGNPGRVAIEAVLFPTESDYFYYITGDDGEFYYADTYSEHLKNVNAHLR